MMTRSLSSLLLFVSVLAVGCVDEDVDRILDEDEFFEERVSLSVGSFVQHYKRDGLACQANEVMVGIHWDSKKVTCAKLGNGYAISSSYYDLNASPTQVSSSPSMHGCVPNYWIQSIQNVGSAKTYKCVSLENASGQALDASMCLHDGQGGGNNGTQSGIYGINNPTMHACPLGYAMRGLHISQNDLYCCG